MKTLLARIVSVIVVGIMTLGLFGCDRKYETVAPNELAMILTPTGFQNDVLKPGSYDIGKQLSSGKGNKMYLIDAGGFSIKEEFVGQTASEDKEDHRCSMQGAQPLTLDVRLFLAIPDVEADDGHKHLARLMSLTAAESVEGRKRVFRINPEKVYKQQAQQEVRGKLRQLCATFENFEAAEKSFSDVNESGMTARIERIVHEVLAAHNVPLTLISAQPSNMKPDQTVIDANAAIIASEARVDAVEKVVEYLGDDPTGHRWEVYRLQTIQEIAKTADGAGNSTILLDLKSGANILPVTSR